MSSMFKEICVQFQLVRKFKITLYFEMAVKTCGVKIQQQGSFGKTTTI